MDGIRKAASRQVQSSFLEVCHDPQSRMLRLPGDWVADCHRRQYVFTLGSIVSWCCSSKGSSFNPRINQIAARSGYSERQTKVHLEWLVQKGHIARLLCRRQPAVTAVSQTIRKLCNKGYLEIPVSVAQLLGTTAMNVGLTASCVMAHILNVYILFRRLEDLQEYGTFENSGGITQQGLARKLNVRPCKVLYACDELNNAGIPIYMYSDCIDFDAEQTFTYVESHDTRLVQ
jgi:hypothetical protein